MKRTVFPLALALSLLALGSLQAAEPRGAAAPFCPATVAASVEPAPGPLSACNAWIETDYYTDASHSTKVGMCTITCMQWDLGNVLPTPGGGGHCTGTTTNFGNDVFHLCPCPP